MTGSATLFGLAGAGLIGLGLYGILVQGAPLRRLLSSGDLGPDPGAAAGLAGDPVPQAIVITGIVVAFCASALAVALMVRLEAVQEDAADGDEGAAK